MSYPFRSRVSLRFVAWSALGIIIALPGSQPLHGADATNHPLLTIDRIFASQEFTEESVGTILWRRQGGGYYTWSKAEGTDKAKDLVRVDPASGREEVIVPEQAFGPSGETALLAIEGFEFSADESKLLLFTNSKRVWRQHNRGDYWVLDVTSRELRRLGGGAPPSSLKFAKFSPDGTRVAYVRDNNLYVEGLRDGRVVALTTNGSATVINGTFDWVYEEELDLRDGFRWSPDGRALAYWQLDASGMREFPLLNNTDGLYPRATTFAYPKTGEVNAAARIGVVSANGGATHWMAVPGDSRDHYLAQMDWASNSTELIIQQFNRLQNTNQVILADAANGETRGMFMETDRAWVDNANPARWIEGGKHLVWLSERDGWLHAYRLSRDGQSLSRITKGDFDVISIDAIDDRDGWLYYSASPDKPTERQLFRVALSGGKAQRMTPHDQPGTHTYSISPDFKWAVHTRSRFDRPPVIELVELPSHKVVRVLESNQKLMEKLDKLNKPKAEFFRVDIGAGVKLDGWCLKPPGFDAARRYPGLFYVYGEPAGQTVADRWLGRTGLWHWMLAQQGYVVMSIDNRGTRAPRGRDWRKCIYRQVGILASADQAAALRGLLRDRSYLDPARIGVWGWSGGGSMTLNAILRYPDLYQVGMAVASVPNQRYYDTIYQERYMGLPDDNAEGYRLGSPLNFAHNLKGKLLVVHGTGDDNVHYQGAEALINELIAHNKPFEMMAYPNRSHGISEGKNTTRHLYGVLTRFLNEHLPANKPVAELPTQRAPEE